MPIVARLLLAIGFEQDRHLLHLGMIEDIRLADTPAAPVEFGTKFGFGGGGVGGGQIRTSRDESMVGQQDGMSIGHRLKSVFR